MAINTMSAAFLSAARSTTRRPRARAAAASAGSAGAIKPSPQTRPPAAAPSGPASVEAPSARTGRPALRPGWPTGPSPDPLRAGPTFRPVAPSAGFDPSNAALLRSVPAPQLGRVAPLVPDVGRHGRGDEVADAAALPDQAPDQRGRMPQVRTVDREQAVLLAREMLGQPGSTGETIAGPGDDHQAAERQQALRLVPARQPQGRLGGEDEGDRAAPQVRSSRLGRLTEKAGHGVDAVAGSGAVQ